MEPRISPICNNEDRISKLPDTLIHHILSFFDMKYAVQTSVLSRRWRHIWSSLPVLNFTDTLFNLPETDLEMETENLDTFVDFVDRVLALRDSSDIHRFRINWEDEEATPSRLNTWILATLKRNVQELCLNATVCQQISFPQSLFNCKWLTKLELEMGSRYVSEVILPNSMGLPRLKYLLLNALQLGDENLTNKLFSSCPVLETLIVMDSHLNFNISSLSLKYFKVLVFAPSDSRIKNVKTVKLCAPNLISFICKDYMTEDYSLENLSSLVTADIDMSVEADGKNETPETYSNLSTEVKELYAQRMVKFLKAVSNVIDLRLSPGFLEVISGAPNILDSQAPQFYNLRRLKLQTWVSRNCMNAITYLLNISPNMESLILTVTELNSADVGDDWEATLSFPCTLDHLKFVKIQGFLACFNELMFLGILLKNGVVLEDVVLVSYEPDSPDKERRVMDFKEKLLTFPTAWTGVTVLYNSC